MIKVKAGCDEPEEMKYQLKKFEVEHIPGTFDFVFLDLNPSTNNSTDVLYLSLIPFLVNPWVHKELNV